MNETHPVAPSPPWWTFGYVWLVLAGPVIVVIAGFVTLYLAVSRPDPLVNQDTYRKGIESRQTLTTDPASLAPAVQARNHAATGTPQPVTKP